MTPRWGRVVALVVALGAVGWASRTFGAQIPVFADWVHRQGPLGPLVFVAGYAVAVVALVPGSLLTLAAGAIFGLGPGIVYVFVGAVLGSSMAFLVGRFLARGAVEKRLARDPRFGKMDQAIGQDGRRIVLLLRLSPVFPFSLLNYGLGLTRIRLVDYLAGSIGMLPGTVLYVYYGKLAGEAATLASGTSQPRGLGYWAVLTVGLIATVVVTLLVTRTAKRALTAAGGLA